MLSGARSLPLSMVAAVTAEGGHAAIVGQPDVGLLAAVEMGADLSRIAVIPEPGADPVEVAAVLMDGMDLVVLGLGGRSVPATRARAVVARARQKGCTLLVTGGDWQGASARLEARVCGYEMTGARCRPGVGRISRVRLAMRARGRSFGAGSGSRRMSVLRIHVAGAGHLVHGLACGRRGGRGGSASHDSGRGHAGQPGHRLFGVGPRGRGAAWPAPPGSPGQVSGAARRHRRSRRAMPATSKT